MQNKKRIVQNRAAICFVSVSLIICFGALPLFAVEKVRLYDWQADVLSGDDQKKRCYIQFSGATNQRIRLSMHLSVIEERVSPMESKTLTLIKISVAQINKFDFSDVTEIKIKDAWVETTTGTSIGRIKKMDVGQKPYFLGGTEGVKLFETLLRGIKQDGVTVGYRKETDLTETIIHTPAPPPSLFLKLLPC